MLRWACFLATYFDLSNTAVSSIISFAWRNVISTAGSVRLNKIFVLASPSILSFAKNYFDSSR